MALKKTALVTNVGSVNMSSNIVTVHKTYKENGEEGKMRVFIYANDKVIADHLVENIEDAIRIKKNYESSLNTSFIFTYTTRT